MRTAVATLVVLLGASTSAFAQGWIGPAYVTRVAEGDLIYAQIGGRMAAVRYLGVDVPIVDHPTRGREPYASVAREENQRLVEGKWIYLVLGTPPRDRVGRLLAYCGSTTCSSTPHSSTGVMSKRPQTLTNTSPISARSKRVLAVTGTVSGEMVTC